MAELPNTFARRPTPRFGGALQAQPVVDPQETAVADALQVAGGEFSKMVKREEIKRDKAELEARTFRYKQRLLELNAEMKEKRSAQVAEDPVFISGYVQRHNEIRDEIMGEITNPRVNRMMAERINLGELNFKESLINHTHKETAVYRKQAYEGSIDTEIDAMQSLAYDGEQTGQSAKDIERLTRDYAAEEGLPADATDALVKKNLTMGHAGVIMRYVNDGNYEEAEAYYEDVSKDITPDGRERIEKLLATAGQRARTQGMVDEIWTRFRDNPKAGREYIRKNARTEDRDAALSRFNNRLAEQEQERNLEFRVAGETARDIFAEARLEPDVSPQEAFDRIPMEVLEAMKPSELMALQDRVRILSSGQQSVKTNPGVYFSVLEQIRENPDGWNSSMLAQFDHLIAFSDLKKLETEISKGPDRLRTEAQVISDGLSAIGLKSSDLTGDPGKDDTVKAQLFRRWVEERLPRDYNDEDLRKTVNSAVTMVRTDEKSFWDFLPGNWDIEKPLFEIDIPGINQTRVEEYVEMLKAAGEEVTEENLIEADALVSMGLPVNASTLKAFRERVEGAFDVTPAPEPTPEPREGRRIPWRP